MIQTETSYMLDTIDGNTFNVIMMDDHTLEDALNKFKGEVSDEFVIDIRVHYSRLTGPGVGPLSY